MMPQIYLRQILNFHSLTDNFLVLCRWHLIFGIHLLLLVMYIWNIGIQLKRLSNVYWTWTGFEMIC